MPRAMLTGVTILLLAFRAFGAEGGPRPWWMDDVSGEPPRPPAASPKEAAPARVPRSGEPVVIQILVASIAFDRDGSLSLRQEVRSDEAAAVPPLRVETLPGMLAERQNAAAAACDEPLLGSAETVHELLEGLGKVGALEFLMRSQLVTVDGQEAMAQVGHRVPRITGVQMSARGRTHTVTLDNVGCLVRATPQLGSDEAVVTALSMEMSVLGPEKEGTLLATSEGGPEVRARRMDTYTVETTVSAPSGKTVVVSDHVRTWEDKVTETFVLLTTLVLGE